MPDHKEVDALHPFLIALNNCHEKFYGRPLIEQKIKASAAATFKNLYEAPYVLLSHELSDDPIFNFANLKGQNLWHMDWCTFTTTPSRKSAELDERSERKKLLDDVLKNGFTDSYNGIRMDSLGQRFTIQNVRVWNVIDENTILGQAACFDRWSVIR
jgi:hypothetical protein